MENINQSLNNLDFETIQLYEVHTEICWASMGFINNYLEADHIVFCLDRNGSYYTEYDYFVNQFVDCPHALEKSNLGPQESIPEQDRYVNSWFPDGIRYDNLFEFWDGTNDRQHQHPENGNIYFEYRSHLCNKNLYMYESKYMCWSSRLSYRYCNQDFCGLCLYHGDVKFENKDYLLYQKFVQPIGGF